MTKKPNKENKDKVKKVKKSSEHIFVRKKTIPKQPSVSEPKKLETGGTVEKPVSYKLVTYDVWGSDKDGCWVNNSFRTDTVVDIPKDATDEEIISTLKGKGILTEKASKSNIKIEGEKYFTMFFKDSDKDMPLFELQNIEEYEMKANGGNLSGSELLKPEYFKTTAPKSSDAPTSAEELKPVEQKKEVELNLPDYNTTQESVVKQHLVNNEIHVVHLQNILNRELKYEEVIGGLKLRKCFLRQSYKIV